MRCYKLVDDDSKCPFGNAFEYKRFLENTARFDTQIAERERERERVEGAGESVRCCVCVRVLVSVYTCVEGGAYTEGTQEANTQYSVNHSFT